MSLAGDKGVLLRPETRTCATANSALDLWQVLVTYRFSDSVYPPPDGMHFNAMMSSLSL